MTSGSFTLKKLECSKQAYALNTLAWNNIGRWVLFCWFSEHQVMIDRDSWGCCYYMARGEIHGFI